MFFSSDITVSSRTLWEIRQARSCFQVASSSAVFQAHLHNSFPPQDVSQNINNLTQLPGNATERNYQPPFSIPQCFIHGKHDIFSGTENWGASRFVCVWCHNTFWGQHVKVFLKLLVKSVSLKMCDRLKEVGEAFRVVVKDNGSCSHSVILKVRDGMKQNNF